MGTNYTSESKGFSTSSSDLDMQLAGLKADLEANAVEGILPANTEEVAAPEVTATSTTPAAAESATLSSDQIPAPTVEAPVNGEVGPSPEISIVQEASTSLNENVESETPQSAEQTETSEPAVEQPPVSKYNLDDVRNDTTGAAAAAALKEAIHVNNDYAVNRPGTSGTSGPIPVPITPDGEELAMARAENKALIKSLKSVDKSVEAPSSQSTTDTNEASATEAEITPPVTLPSNKELGGDTTAESKPESVPEPAEPSGNEPAVTTGAPEHQESATNSGPEIKMVSPNSSEVPNPPDAVLDGKQTTSEPEPVQQAADSAKVEAPAAVFIHELTMDEKIANLVNFAANASDENLREVYYEGAVRLGLLSKTEDGYLPLTPEGETLLASLKAQEVSVDHDAPMKVSVATTPTTEVIKPESIKIISAPRGAIKIPSTTVKPKTPKTPKQDQKSETVKPPEPSAEDQEKLREATAKSVERQKAMDQAKTSAQTEQMTERLLGNLKDLDPALVLTGVDSNGEPLSLDDRLRNARQAVATLQAKERHGMIFHHIDRQQLDAVDASYRDLVKLRMVEKVKAEIAEGKTEKEIRLSTIDLLSSEAHEMSKAEIAAAEKRPGAKLQKFLQTHKKSRIAVGLSLTAIGVVSTAAGIMPLAGVALVGRALLSGATTYYGAKRALNVSSALGSRKVGSRKRLEDESYDALLKTSYYQKISGLLSSDTLNTEATKKMKAGDQEEISKLEAAESERLEWKLYRESNLKGKNVVELTMGILAERRDSDVKQLEKDRRGNIKRTLGALAIAGAASALTIHVGMDKIAGARPKLSDIQKPAPTAPQTTGGAAAKAVEKATQAGLDNAPAHYADMHQVVPGESIWKISHNYLVRYDGDWSKLSPQEQLLKTDRLKDIILKQQHAKSLLMPGQTIKMPWSAVKNAINYKQ